MPIHPQTIAGFARLAAVAAALFPASAGAQVALTSSGQPQAVILTRPNPPGYVQLAAQEVRDHIELMSGAMLPIDVVGAEGSYQGMNFVYVGASAATAAAGISTAGLTLEHYVIRTVGGNLHVVGRDGGDDIWYDLSDCQPGTLFGVYHLLGEILGVRWIWPGESGRWVPAQPSVVVPYLSITTGPAMVQRKYRTPRVGLYLGGATSYGFGVPVLPESAARRQELALEDLLWLRRMRMGTRKNFSFAHSQTTWWATYGAMHPDYFAVLLPGKTQPHPAADRVKLHVSNPAVWQRHIDDWVAAGAGSNLNVSPNDSRSFCVCASCLAWDRPSQAPEVVFDSSAALLGDRYARYYTEIADRVKFINPAATVYGTAYDVWRHAPLEATIPDNVALAYVPGPPSDTVLSQIAETEADVLGWIASGCEQMYLRPNWMLSAHAGPFWPARRVGEHFRNLTQGGSILGFDSDSSCSSYASFGLYYYLICRLIADPSLEIDAILDEYCAPFGSASPAVRDYLAFWENFIYNQADSGSTEILGWASCVAAYPGSYTDRAFDGALRILDAAATALGPGETDAAARLEFLRLACLHGRLTAQAVALVDPGQPLSANPEAERAMRALLAFRDRHAESFALWREWVIDRESFVPNMESYWTSIFATPDEGYGSNVGAFIESGGEVSMEAEHATAAHEGTGAAAGIAWQETAGPAGASGTVMEALPNAGVGTDTGTWGPRLDFVVDFHTAGTYYVFLHLPTLPGSDDSVNIGLDGSLVASNLGNTTGSWRWRTTNPATIGLDIAAAGVHTFHVWMREDGAVLDKVILTTNPSFSLPGTDLGPPESGLRGIDEYLLSVADGTGDGFYGESSLVPVTANAAPAGRVFDRWTGDTAHLDDASSPGATLTMAAHDIAIAATYMVDPALDTDGDGMEDSWETARFGDTVTASGDPDSDQDRDGSSDLEEFLADSDPGDAGSRLAIEEISASAAGETLIRWQGAAGRTYTIEKSAALDPASWTPIAVGVPGMAPLTTYTVRFASPPGFVRVLVE